MWEGKVNVKRYERWNLEDEASSFKEPKIDGKIKEFNHSEEGNPYLN